MKNLYLLSRKELIQYDENYGMVVRASSPALARKLANKRAADEGPIWTDAKKTDCRVLRASGPERIVIISFNAG